MGVPEDDASREWLRNAHLDSDCTLRDWRSQNPESPIVSDGKTVYEVTRVVAKRPIKMLRGGFDAPREVFGFKHSISL